MRTGAIPWMGSSGALLAAFVPHCPFCATAATALLSSLGLSVAASVAAARWLIPASLVVGLVGLAAGHPPRRARWLVAIGGAGSVAAYAGWTLERTAVALAGAALVLLASLVSIGLRRRRPAAGCASCEPSR